VSNRPLTLLVAAVITALEGVVALALGGFVALETVIGAPADVLSSLVVAVFGLAIGAGLLWAAKGMLDAERWSRAPGVITQIIALPIAITLIQAGQLAMGVLLLAAALTGLLALLAPPTTQALYGEDAGDNTGGNADDA
jgi:hypothetical protein